MKRHHVNNSQNWHFLYGVVFVWFGFFRGGGGDVLLRTEGKNIPVPFPLE